MHVHSSNLPPYPPHLYPERYKGRQTNSLLTKVGAKVLTNTKGLLSVTHSLLFRETPERSFGL